MNYFFTHAELPFRRHFLQNGRMEKLSSPFMRKALLMAKLTCLLLLAAFMQVSATGYSQDLVSINFKDTKVSRIFHYLEKKSDYVFYYNNDEIGKLPRINLSLKNATVPQVLDSLSQTLALRYNILDHNLIVIHKNDHVLTQIQQIQGKVTDSTGNPLIGVSVQIKGTSRGTVTDANGHYEIEAPEDATLVFSYVGYQDKEIAVNGREAINATLSASATGLNEVIVVGYGKQKKVDLTGAVDQVSGEVLQNRPITNVGRGLQGVIPNLNVINRDGNPNSEPQLNIRGTTSINGGGPLVLVDNVQMDPNLINPNDIASITVLKDAASAAIYGARGAFGVILITLKDGARNEKPQISYLGDIEFRRPTYLPDMLSSLEYMESINIARKRRYGSVVYSDQEIQWLKDYIKDPKHNPKYHMLPNGSIFWHANVDNFGQLLRKWTPVQNHSLSISGGSKKTTYYASLGYRRQEGLFKGITDIFKRYNVLLNLNTNVTNWWQVGFKASYTNKSYDQPHNYRGKGNIWNQMARGKPQILFPIHTPKDAPIPDAPTEHFYNFLTAGGRNVSRADVGLYSINTQVNITKGLKLKGDFNYERSEGHGKDERVRFGYVRDKWQFQYNHTTPSFVTRTSSQSNYFAANAYLTYDKTFHSNHNISVLLGFNQEWKEVQGFNVEGDELVSNDIPVLDLATGNIYAHDNESSWAIRGIFGRLTYNFKHKYLFEFNSRYDGSSRFPSYSRFHFFPSFSGGWRISEEKFMEGTHKVLDNLKIRASYGSLGNQNISDPYPYIARFSVTNPINYILGDVTPLGINPPGLVSPNLTWETATTIDFGLDAALFGKLSLTYDWYKRKTTDMLVQGEKLPAVLGTNAPRRNGAKLKTIGQELSIKYRDQTSFGLTYNLRLIVSDYQATITEYNANPNKLHTTYYVGQKLGEIWGYETVGIYQTDAEAAKGPDESRLADIPRYAGDIEFADLNGDGKIDFGDNTVSNPGDEKIIGNSTPRYQFGFTGSFGWKGFDLRIFFQGVGKKDLYPRGNYFWGVLNSNAAVGTKDVYYHSWSKENPDAYYPIYKQSSRYNITTQTRYLQNAAYIRLKNLTIGYSLPKKLIKRINIQKVRLYFSGENLWEFTKLRGNFDPEVVTFSRSLGMFYPLQRTLSFGLQIVL